VKTRYLFIPPKLAPQLAKIRARENRPLGDEIVLWIMAIFLIGVHFLLEEDPFTGAVVLIAFTLIVYAATGLTRKMMKTEKKPPAHHPSVKKGVRTLIYVVAAITLVTLVLFNCVTSECTGYLYYLCEYADFILAGEILVIALFIVGLRSKKRGTQEGVIQGL
jgi:polyferredoxin